MVYYADDYLFIGPGTTDNPVIVIANYVFDTLNSDTFRVDNGELYEGYISVGSKRRFEPVLNFWSWIKDE